MSVVYSTPARMKPTLSRGAIVADILDVGCLQPHVTELAARTFARSSIGVSH